MAATILNSPRAVEVSIYVVRAFVRLRELVKRLDELEQKTEAVATCHEAFSRETRPATQAGVRCAARADGGA